MKIKTILLALSLITIFARDGRSQCSVVITPQGPTSFCEGGFVTLIANADGNTPVIDQFQNLYNGGMSARTLPGYSFWQAFTAGMTGTLSRIDIGFFNYINGVGILSVYAGTGLGGTLLQSLQVNVFCATGNCMIPFTVNVPIVAGQVYTFHFTPGAGIPDPYGVQIHNPGTYTGGDLYLVDPSGTYNTGFDLVFNTWVAANFFYSWNNGTIGPSLIADSTGSYIVTATDSVGCTTTDTIQVEVYTLPSVYLGNDTAITTGQILILDAGMGYANCLWSTGQASQSIIINSTGTYFVQVTDQNGCIRYDTIVISLTTSLPLEVYTLDDISYSSVGQKLILRFSKDWENTVLGIYDMTGKVAIPFRSVMIDKVEIDFNNYPKGIYLLQIFNEREKIIKKIVR